MKLALLQQATRTTTGTQDWTDASVTSDLVTAIFWGNDATTNASLTGTAKQFFGATDLTRNIAFSMGTNDAAAAGSTNSHTYASSTLCIIRASASGIITLNASYNATLSNGVRINYPTVDGGAYLVNGLLISGTDMSVTVSSVLFASTDTSKVVTHNDTSAPDSVLVFCSPGSTALDAAGLPQKAIIGMWDGTNSVGTAMKCSASISPTDLAGRINTDLGHQISNIDVDEATISIGSVGATTFTLTRTATGSVAMAVVCVSFRHKTGNYAAKAFQTTLPTSTGNAALVTGMAVKPQLLITIPTRLTSTTFVGNSDAAGSIGIGISVNNAGTTQQMASAMTEKNAVTTTVSKCYALNNAALLALNNAGGVVNQATVNSWDSGGVTLNHSAVGASAFEAIGIALGIASNASHPGLLTLGMG